MKKGTRIGAVGVVLGLASAFLGYFSVYLLWEDIRPWRVYSVRFAKTRGLAKGDRVLAFGLQVGRVKKIALEGDHQLATLEVDPEVVVYTRNPKVSVRTVDSFGTQVVEIDPGDPTIGRWDPLVPLEGVSSEGPGFVIPDDPSGQGVIAQAIDGIDTITEQLTRSDGGIFGRFINDHDLGREFASGIHDFRGTIGNLKATVANAASGGGPGALISPERRSEVVEFTAGLAETLEQVAATSRDAAVGEGGFYGRLVGDRDAADSVHQSVDGVSAFLEGYRLGEGRLAWAIGHPPEPAERVLAIVDGFADDTRRWRDGEDRIGGLVGRGTGPSMTQTLATLEKSLDAARRSDPDSGSLFSVDPSGSRSLKEIAARLDDVLQDMRKALGRIRADQSPNTFQGALFSIF